MSAEPRYTLACDMDAAPGCRNGDSHRPYADTAAGARAHGDRKGWRHVTSRGADLDICPACLPAFRQFTMQAGIPVTYHRA